MIFCVGFEKDRRNGHDRCVSLRTLKTPETRSKFVSLEFLQSEKFDA